MNFIENSNTQVSVRQAREMDRRTIERVGIPSFILMENAGREIAGRILRRFKKNKSFRVCLCCGSGNNAGDGFVIARYLHEAGANVAVYGIASGKEMKPDPRLNLAILQRLKIPVTLSARMTPAWSRQIGRADCVVDALFGVGLNRPVVSPFDRIIETINKKSRDVVSVDLPSGLDGDTGDIYGVCVRAKMTVTPGFVKKGMITPRGKKYCGRVIPVDIGIPRKVVADVLGRTRP